MSQPPEQPSQQPPAWGAPDQPAHSAQPQPPSYPYAAQPYPTQPYPAQSYGWSAFHDVTALGTAAIVLAALVTLGDLLAAATSFAAADTFRAAGGAGEFTAHDGFNLIALLMIPNWLVVSLWLSRARRNAEQLAPAEVRRGNAWCWWGWIVPIIAFWFPKQMVDDVWRGSATGLPPGDPDRRERLPSPPTGLWWGLYLTYAILGNFYQVAFPDTRDDGGVVPGLEIVIAIASVAALVAWIRVVRGLSRVQRVLATGPTTGPTTRPA